MRGSGVHTAHQTWRYGVALEMHTVDRHRWEGASMIMIHADELRAGDIVDYHGCLHQVAHVERRDGWAWPVAFDDAGWAMAVGHEVVTVLRAA